MIYSSYRINHTRGIIMRLYEKITLFRKKNGLSQEELAEKIGVSRQAVSKWETGDALPEITKLKALAETFNVTVDFLLDDEKEEFSQQIDPQNFSALDRYVDKIDDCVDNISNKSGTFLKKYGWISGILLIILGLYRTITCVLSILPIFQFSFSAFDTMIPGVAIIFTIFQILIGIAFIVGGIIIIKKFKPKKQKP